MRRYFCTAQQNEHASLKTKTNTMRILLSIAISTLAITSCSKTSIRGSGNTVSDTRTVPEFTRVEAKGSSDVEIKKGTQQRVEIRGYENLVPIYETRVTNGILVLKFKNDYYNVRNNNIKVFIEVPTLEMGTLDGSGKMLVNDVTGADLTVSINGSGDININNCTYTNTFLRINGSGNLLAANSTSVNADAKIVGSGKIDVRCTAKLKATIDGSGDINYWGSPAVVESEIRGSGNIRKK